VGRAGREGRAVVRAASAGPPRGGLQL